MRRPVFMPALYLYKYIGDELKKHVYTAIHKDLTYNELVDKWGPIYLTYTCVVPSPCVKPSVC